MLLLDGIILHSPARHYEKHPNMEVADGISKLNPQETLYQADTDQAETAPRHYRRDRDGEWWIACLWRTALQC